MAIISRINSIIHSLAIYPLQFNYFGWKSKIVSPLRIDGAKHISIGKGVYIGYKIWIGTFELTGEEPLLRISDNCHIGNFNHIIATKQIIIENNVLTADKVCILDNLHEYADVEVPIWKQSIKQLPSIVIGEGSWIGENVTILGASVGKHSVIGANSVVTHDIPDYCVAVGNPAKVIKRYNFETKEWDKA